MKTDAPEKPTINTMILGEEKESLHLAQILKDLHSEKR